MNKIVPPLLLVRGLYFVFVIIIMLYFTIEPKYHGLLGIMLLDLTSMTENGSSLPVCKAFTASPPGCLVVNVPYVYISKLKMLVKLIPCLISVSILFRQVILAVPNYAY